MFVVLISLLAIFFVNAVLLIRIALLEAGHPHRALTWLLFGLVLPLVSPLVYWLLSRPLPQRQGTEDHVDGSDLKDAGMSQKAAETVPAAIARLTGAQPLRGDVQLFHEGQSTFDSLFQAISQAQHSIDVEYYIYRDDDVGRAMTDLLLSRALEGVHIRFLRDGLASRKFPTTQLTRMQAAGIETRSFFPYRAPWVEAKLNHRDHDKIVVIDQKTGYTGGINIGDEYTGKSSKTGPWRDTHLRLSGDCVAHLSKVFEMNWSIATPDRSFARPATGHPISINPMPRLATEFGLEFGQEDAMPGVAPNTMNTGGPTENEPSKHPDKRQSEALVQTIQSGPDTETAQIHYLFFLAIASAKRQIEITTPYFSPELDIMTALRTAVARGVKVRLLVPEMADHLVVGLSSWAYFDELVEAGVEVILYQNGVLHAKVMTVDEDLSVVGAANYDLRSFRLNYECATLIVSAEITKQLRRQFEVDIEKYCKRLTLDGLKARSKLRRGAEQAARAIAPLL